MSSLIGVEIPANVSRTPASDLTSPHPDDGTGRWRPFDVDKFAAGFKYFSEKLAAVAPVVRQPKPAAVETTTREPKIVRVSGVFNRGTEFCTVSDALAMLSSHRSLGRFEETGRGCTSMVAYMVPKNRMDAFRRIIAEREEAVRLALADSKPAAVAACPNCDFNPVTGCGLCQDCRHRDAEYTPTADDWAEFDEWTASVYTGDQPQPTEEDWRANVNAYLASHGLTEAPF